MKLSEFDYELPEELIAQEPAEPRDASRLLHLAPDGAIEHTAFTRLPELLDPDDLLVVNDTRVFPARLLGTRPAGGAVELLLLEDLGAGSWRVLAKPARKLRRGMVLTFGGGALRAEVAGTDPVTVRFEHEGAWNDVVDAVGRTPLPPYIDANEDEAATRERYQTIYAQARGSIAAPTAGLHFTPRVLEALDARGVRVVSLTLHVGHATFAPIRTEDVGEHRMGSERYAIAPDAAERIRSARRVVAVGTTSVRALESAARVDFAPGWHDTDLFIKPGFDFKVVGGLLTNFHLPRSTLLMLVSAFAGREAVLAAYREAVSRRYRFYSFGDAMLVLAGC